MKFLKTEKYWLKGGLIAMGVIILINIVSVIIAFGLTPLFKQTQFYEAWSLVRFTETIYGIVIIPFFFAYMILVIVFKAPFDGAHPTGTEQFMWGALAILLEALIIFAIGALIGQVIGKIKSKKNIQAVVNQ